MTEIFRTEIDADGVATLSWDLPDRSMNVMTLEGFEQLESAVERLLTDDAVKGIVLTSAKPDFAGGMDLSLIAGIKHAASGDAAAQLFGFLTRMHKLMRRLELAGMDPKTKKGGKPVAWASPGTAAGIGLELGLACHRRFAADNPKAKIGLPEIMVGLFPGAGGATRVSRMLGAMAAAPFLLEGRMQAPAKVKAAGLIDEVVPADELLARAKAWVLSATDADLVKPWDGKG
jgi:Enoyl-CoA hydratase/carnithine racemase